MQRQGLYAESKRSAQMVKVAGVLMLKTLLVRRPLGSAFGDRYGRLTFPYAS